MNIDVIRKLGCILNKKQKSKIFGLGVLILIGGLLETLGVSMILPVVTSILDVDGMSRNKYVILVCDKLHLENMNEFIILLLMVVIVIFVVKNAYLLFLSYVQAKFVNGNQHRAGSYMLEEYLNRPYEFYLNADIPTIFRILDGDIPKVFQLLLSVIKLATEVVVAVCLFAVLLVIDIKMTMMMMVLMLLMTFVIIKVLKPILNKVGKENQEVQSLAGRWRTKSVYGIKDVKVLNREHFFASFYEKHTRRGLRLTIQYSVLNGLPRTIIETVLVAGILAYIAVCIASGVNVTSLLSQITAFGVAAIRLMPSMNRINTYLTDIAFYEPSLDYVYENVDFSKYKEEGRYIADEPENPEPVVIDDDIRLEHITYVYPNTDKKILDDAQMIIPYGKSVGVVGPSGAGKSTVIDIILGLLHPQKGRIMCRDRNVLDNYPSWLSNIGYIPQTIYLSDDSIRDNIAFGVPADEIDDARIWQVLEEAQMKHFVEQLPEGLDTSTGDRGVRISGGERQRLGIARALYHNPDILVFDEATSALDNATEKAVMEAIESFHGKKTLVIIAHRLNTLESCDVLYRVQDGKVQLEEKSR
ncbi:MAG: ABC transporter ATP-binding protein [Lachnospiraceae bacterium]|nr:ABC transporter ATP-binding protein [Lachnospiraceae bacterium]